MKKTDCFQLGYIAKLHGYKGEVSLFLDVSDPDKYAGLEAFYLDIDEQLVPFMVLSAKQKGKGQIALRLEGVDSEEAATRLLKKAVYLPDSFLESLDDKHFYDHEVIGFTVIDLNFGEVGELKDVFDSTATTLLQVFHGEKEVLIPLLPGLVQKVNRTDKQLLIESPDGLLNLYL